MEKEDKKLNREIAKVLLELAKKYPEEAEADAPKAVFQFGTFIIRCRPTAPAVRAVAEKYKRSALLGPGLKPFSMRAAYNQLRCVGPYEWR